MNWLKRNRKEQSQSPKQCDCSSTTECPYPSPEQCNFNKDKCVLIAEKKNKRPGKNVTQTLIIIALVALLGYILTIIFFKESSHDNESLCSYLRSIVIGVCLSVFTGAILALFIDIPSRLRDYEKSFIAALSSNHYLKTLDEQRLTTLRNDATEQLHKTKAPNMAKGLIKFDQNILDLLRQPYYSFYRHSVYCKTSDDGKNYIKTHTIEYRLVNPYSIYREATEYIKLRNLVLVKDGKWNDKMLDLNIQCQIDDKKEIIDFKDRIAFTNHPLKSEFYNTEVTLYDSKGDDSAHGIRVDFSDNIKVKMTYNITVNKEDPCFTKRLQHPAKNFRLDYGCDDPNINLYGQIFGTQLKQSDISINYNNESMSLETFDWLLPTNGAIVVMLNNHKTQ